MSRDPREPSGWWGEPGRPDPDDRRRSDSDSQSFLGLQLWQQIVAGLAVAAIIAIIGFLYHHAQHPEAGKSGSSHNSIPISSNGPSSSTQPAGDVPTLPDQAGYNSRWQQSIIIDNNGVIFQQAGPVSAAGTYGADLTYYDGSGWGGTESDLSLWLSHGVPTPTECEVNNSGHTGIGTLAEAGDRYCFINNQSPNGPIVVSLEVTRIQTDSTTGVTSVTLDAWAWAPQSSSNGQSSAVQLGGDVPTLPDQAGYNSLWHRSIIIDNNGVIFQQAGPVSAAGTYGADLTYYDGSGWGGTESDLSLWLSHGVPTPTECVGNNSGYTGIGTLVENGDRYCFINNQSPNGPIVISLEVTRIQTDSTKGVTSVTLDASAWAPR